MDPKAIVRQGYDKIAGEYARMAPQVKADDRDRYIQLLVEQLPRGASILELGCGSGDPVTRELAKRFAVVGVDISERLLEIARQNVPEATFLQADMAALDLPPGSFDAVAAFYSIPHLPREEQGALLRKIAGWLKPRGLLVASFGPGLPAEHVEENWMGVPMYFGSYDGEASKWLVQASGLEILSSSEHVTDVGGRPATYLWIVACCTHMDSC